MTRKVEGQGPRRWRRSANPGQLEMIAASLEKAAASEPLSELDARALEALRDLLPPKEESLSSGSADGSSPAP